MVAGPYVNREHTTVAIVESDRPEAVDTFLMQSRLPQWNRVRVIPSFPMEEGMKDIAGEPLSSDRPPDSTSQQLRSVRSSGEDNRRP